MATEGSEMKVYDDSGNQRLSRVLMCPEKQVLNVHTTFYEHFFVLVLDIRTAGETLQLQGLNQQLLKLTCSQKGFAFSQATLLSAVSEACVKHGAFHVPRMRCGELPIFEIDFISSKSLHTFLSALGNGQFEGLLSLLLTKQINGMTTNSSASMENVTKFSITSDLFLLLCNSRGGGSGMREPELLHVTLANCQHCLNIVEEGQLFNYGALFRSSALRAGREENTEVIIDAVAVVKELQQELSQWFTLGFFLCVPMVELERIQQTYQSRKEGLIFMVDAWIKGGEASWPALVRALQTEGRYLLAKKIATKHGVHIESPQPASPKHQMFQEFSASGAMAITATQLFIQLQQQSQCHYRQLQMESKRDHMEQELRTNLKGIRENIREVTEKMSELTYHHQDILQSLQRKQHQRSRLLQQQDRIDDRELIAELVEEIDTGIRQLHQQMDSLEQEMLHYRQQKDRQEARLALTHRELVTQTKALQESRIENHKLQAIVDENHEVLELMMQIMVSQKSANDRVHEKLKEEILSLKNKLLISQNVNALENAEMMMSVVVKQECVDGSPTDMNKVADRCHIRNRDKRLGSTPLPRAPPGKKPLSDVGKARTVPANLQLSIRETSPQPSPRAVGRSSSSDILDSPTAAKNWRPSRKSSKSMILSTDSVPDFQSLCSSEWELNPSMITLMSQRNEMSRDVMCEYWTGWLNLSYEEMKRHQRHPHVAVKVLQDAKASQLAEFLAEAEKLKDLQHPHIIKLYGVCSLCRPYMMVMEHSNGTLLQFLKRNQQIKIHEQVHMALQVATGMAYLESIKFVHKQLQAACVLVGERKLYKISLTPLLMIGCNPPVRWTAPQAIYDSEFDIKSDVWSFGVTLYEILTHGQTPYVTMTNQEVMMEVRRSYRMPCPHRCPKELYKIMTDCWQEEPAKRPNFATLHIQLQAKLLRFKQN